MRTHRQHTRPWPPPACSPSPRSPPGQRRRRLGVQRRPAARATARAPRSRSWSAAWTRSSTCPRCSPSGSATSRRRGPRRRAAQRARRVPGRDRAGRRPGPGRRRLLRPHRRPAGQGQVRRVRRAVLAGARRGRGGLHEGRRRHHVAQGLQGQEARRHRPRLLDRLPHPVPRRQERHEGQRLHAGRRRRGPTFIAALQKGAIDARHDHRPDRRHDPRQGPGKVLVDMRTPEGSQEALGGLYPSSSLYMRLSWVNEPQGRPCRSWPTRSSRR